MNMKTRQSLALFAATALTASCLVACAPKASTNAGSQKAESSETSQSSEMSIPKQTEEKPSESTSPTASSSTSTSQTEQSAEPSSTTTNATPSSTPSATSTETAPQQPGITGWLLGACRVGSNSSTPDVTSATLSGGTLTIEGDMGYSESESSSLSKDSSSWISGPITLTVNEGTRWEGRGGIAEPMELGSDKVLEMINSHNGLGLLIQVEDGVARTISMCS